MRTVLLVVTTSLAFLLITSNCLPANKVSVRGESGRDLEVEILSNAVGELKEMWKDALTEHGKIFLANTLSSNNNCLRDYFVRSITETLDALPKLISTVGTGIANPILLIYSLPSLIIQLFELTENLSQLIHMIDMNEDIMQACIDSSHLMYSSHWKGNLLRRLKYELEQTIYAIGETQALLRVDSLNIKILLARLADPLTQSTHFLAVASQLLKGYLKENCLKDILTHDENLGNLLGKVRSVSEQESLDLDEIWNVIGLLEQQVPEQALWLEAITSLKDKRECHKQGAEEFLTGESHNVSTNPLHAKTVQENTFEGAVFPTIHRLTFLISQVITRLNMLANNVSRKQSLLSELKREKKLLSRNCEQIRQETSEIYMHIRHIVDTHLENREWESKTPVGPLLDMLKGVKDGFLAYLNEQVEMLAKKITNAKIPKVKAKDTLLDDAKSTFTMMNEMKSAIKTFLIDPATSNPKLPCGITLAVIRVFQTVVKGQGTGLLSTQTGPNRVKNPEIKFFEGPASLIIQDSGFNFLVNDHNEPNLQSRVKELALLQAQIELQNWGIEKQPVQRLPTNVRLRVEETWNPTDELQARLDALKCFVMAGFGLDAITVDPTTAEDNHLISVSSLEFSIERSQFSQHLEHHGLIFGVNHAYHLLQDLPVQDPPVQDPPVQDPPVQDPPPLAQELAIIPGCRDDVTCLWILRYPHNERLFYSRKMSNKVVDVYPQDHPDQPILLLDENNLEYKILALEIRDEDQFILWFCKIYDVVVKFKMGPKHFRPQAQDLFQKHCEREEGKKSSYLNKVLKNIGLEVQDNDGDDDLVDDGDDGGNRVSSVGPGGRQGEMFVEELSESN